MVPEDGVGDLRRVDEVHLEQASLQVPLLGLVVLERVEEERSRLLNHVLAHEDVDDALDVDKRAHLVVDELRGKVGAVLRVQPRNVLQKRGVVGSVADALGVDDDLGILARLGKARDDLVRDIGAQVDRQGQSHVVRTDNVAELFAAFNLETTPDPDQHWPCSLRGWEESERARAPCPP